MRFTNHKYTWSKPFTAVRHQWELVGPEGGIHLHVSLHEAKFGGNSCGLEFHRAAWSMRRPPKDAPSQGKCWLIGGPCWHDGTSLYASEHVWPIVQSMLRSGDHEAIFRLLEGEYDSHFGKPEIEEEETA
jgi:hypothetical protein